VAEEELKPAALWAAITEMPRPSRLVDFPRTYPEDHPTKAGQPVGQVRIRVLTQEESMMCSTAAEAFARKHIKEIPKSDDIARGYNDLYSNAAAVEVLYRACRQVEDVEKPMFPTAKMIRDHLSADEVGVLFSSYLAVKAELGPIIGEMTEDEVDGWIKRLVEGGSSYPLGSLSWEMRDQLQMLTAQRLYPSLTVTSSPGSPPAEGESSAPE